MNTVGFVPKVPASAMPGVPMRYRALKTLRMDGVDVPPGTLLTLEQQAQFTKQRLQNLLIVRYIELVSLEEALALNQPQPKAPEAAQPVVKTAARPPIKKRR